MNKKLKLALGLGLGTIVSTAAITTMAVSCSNDESNKPYISTEALKQMNTNMAKYQDALNSTLSHNGRKLSNFEGKVWTSGNHVYILVTYTVTGGNTNTTYQQWDITLPSVNGEYDVIKTDYNEENGTVSGGSKTPKSEKVPKEEVEEGLLNAIYTGKPYIPPHKMITSCK